MSQEERKKNEIENRIATLSKGIRDLRNQQELLKKLTKEILKLYKDAEQRERQLELSMFWRGLIVGILGGIFGDYFVSYLMKYHESFDYPPWIWLASTVSVFLGIMVMILYMWKKSKEMPKNI